MRQDLRSVVIRGNGRRRHAACNRPVAIRDDDGVTIGRVRNSRKEERGGFRPNVRFGVLRRFLASRVGEPWDVVRSDLVRAFGNDDLAFLVDWDVDEHTMLAPDGSVVDARGRVATDIHVDPRDGRLANGAGRPWASANRRRNLHRPLLDPEALPLAGCTDEGGVRTELRLLEGIWFHLAYRRADDMSGARRGLAPVRDWRGVRVFEETVRKRQVPGADIRRIGLGAWHDLSRTLWESLRDGPGDDEAARSLRGILKAARACYGSVPRG